MSAVAGDAGSLSLYVYYRLAADCDRAAAMTAVRAMQAALAHRSGVCGELQQRRDDALTWMEVYSGIADGTAFEAALADAVASHRIATLTGSAERHLERFVRCA